MIDILVAMKLKFSRSVFLVTIQFTLTSYLILS